jgi:REP element-mobilizing transposase RayT
VAEVPFAGLDCVLTTPLRKSARHPSIDYAQAGRAFSVTIATRNRVPFFLDMGFGSHCVDLLRRVCDSTQTKCFAYCLMPDHVDLLLGLGDFSLSSVVGSWKSLCYQARNAIEPGEVLWQHSFFDRAVRKQDDLRQAAEYVLNNPVRAGLVADFRAYPLCGSFEYLL